MPKMSEGLFYNSRNEPTTYYNWTADIADTISSRHLIFPNPPYEVGLWTLLLKTTDSGGGPPGITAKLYFAIDPNGTYYDDTGLTLSDIHGNASFTSGGTFVARLDTNNAWCFSNGFKITLTRDSDAALIINYGEIVAI